MNRFSAIIIGLCCLANSHSYAALTCKTTGPNRSVTRILQATFDRVQQTYQEIINRCADRLDESIESVNRLFNDRLGHSPLVRLKLSYSELLQTFHNDLNTIISRGFRPLDSNISATEKCLEGRAQNPQSQQIVVEALRKIHDILWQSEAFIFRLVDHHLDVLKKRGNRFCAQLFADQKTCEGRNVRRLLSEAAKAREDGFTAAINRVNLEAKCNRVALIELANLIIRTLKPEACLKSMNNLKQNFIPKILMRTESSVRSQAKANDPAYVHLMEKAVQRADC